MEISYISSIIFITDVLSTNNKRVVRKMEYELDENDMCKCGHVRAFHWERDGCIYCISCLNGYPNTCDCSKFSGVKK